MLESKLQSDICVYMKLRGWYTKVTTGGRFQSGFPDIYATHAKYGVRWIEVKLPDRGGKNMFTPAQKKDFPIFWQNGTPIWILIASDGEDYKKLFKFPNLSHYMKVDGFYVEENFNWRLANGNEKREHEAGGW